MKKLSIKYLTAAGLLSTTFLFAEVSVSLGVNVGVDGPRPAIMASVFEMDRYYDKPVYLYNDRYYYGGEYRNGYYYHNGHRLNGGQYYNRARFYDHDQPRRIIVNNYNGYGIFMADRYYDEPVYFYKGRYYYGGEYKNGYYYHDGHRLNGGEYYYRARHYDRNQPRIIANNYNGYGIFVADRYYDEPVYFYKGRYYYGGKYKHGYYYHNGHKLRGGQFYANARIHHKHNMDRNGIGSHENNDRFDRENRDTIVYNNDKNFRSDNYDEQRDRNYRHEGR